MKKRILIIYATYGSGHKAIANYIKNYFNSKNDELEIKAIDLLDYSGSKRAIIGKKVSENLMLHHPLIWSVIYRASDHRLTCDFSNKVILKPFKNKILEKEITDFNPDLTIATHFYGSSIVSDYNKKGITNSKIISIVTDYDAHEMWLKNIETQEYIVVCSKEEQRNLIKKGYNKNKIKPFGIPIYPNKEEIDNKNIMLKKMGLDPNLLTCVCFTGGGNGSTATLPYLKAVLKQNKKINLIIISGKNQKSYDKVKHYINKYDVKNVSLFGFVNNVPELLQACDFVITKPGGAQTTECLYFKKPMLLIKSSGGQENYNIKYFTWKGYARRFRTPLRLAKYFKKLENNTKDIDRMKKRLNKDDSQNSMKKIYELCMNTIK